MSRRRSLMSKIEITVSTAEIQRVIADLGVAVKHFSIHTESEFNP